MSIRNLKSWIQRKKKEIENLVASQANVWDWLCFVNADRQNRRLLPNHSRYEPLISVEYKRLIELWMSSKHAFVSILDKGDVGSNSCHSKSNLIKATHQHFVESGSHWKLLEPTLTRALI